MSHNIAPVPMSVDHLDGAAAVLARAAVDDPIFVHCLPDSAERARGVPLVMQYFLKLGLTHGEIWTTPAPISGAAWWSRPNDPKIAPEDREGAGLSAVAGAWGEGAFGRFRDFAADISEVASAAADRPHWHLSWIGVEPAQQGNGIGSALLRHLLKRIDDSGVECDLFDFVPENVPLYEHFGFRVASDSILPRSGLRLWHMMRQPA